VGDKEERPIVKTYPQSSSTREDSPHPLPLADGIPRQKNLPAMFSPVGRQHVVSAHTIFFPSSDKQQRGTPSRGKFVAHDVQPV